MLRTVRRRPGMYFGHGDLTFDRLVVFLVGLDIGTHGRLLDGLREYLILRLNEESSLWWPGLAIRASAPHVGPRPSTPDDDRAAVDGILEILDEFLAEFPEGRSRKRLYHEYYLWKQHLSFFDLDLERFRRSPRPDMITVDAAATVLGISRIELFDLVADGKLEVFRSGAELLVNPNRMPELQTTDTPAPDTEDPP